MVRTYVLKVYKVIILSLEIKKKKKLKIQFINHNSSIVDPNLSDNINMLIDENYNR